jgi:hypothetical protein
MDPTSVAGGATGTVDAGNVDGGDCVAVVLTRVAFPEVVVVASPRSDELVETPSPAHDVVATSRTASDALSEVRNHNVLIIPLETVATLQKVSVGFPTPG